MPHCELVIREADWPMASAARFYVSSQASRKPRWIKVGFVGVHRPRGAGDAPRENDERRGAGEALGPVMLEERLPYFRLLG